jgi:hypothetical protein
MMTIERATVDELASVLQVLNEAAERVHARGLDQWPHGFDADRIGPYVALAEMWLVRDTGGRAVATVRVTADADPDFWGASEAAELALYVSKLARVPDAAPGTGELLLRWVTDHAASLGYTWVRLDAWRTNTGLHEYYRARGWDVVRTVQLPHRRSGALFQRSARPDPEARAMFASPRPRGPWLGVGDRVRVTRGEQRGTLGTVTAVDAPYDHEVAPRAFQDAYADMPSLAYWVQGDGRPQPERFAAGDLAAL